METMKVLKLEDLENVTGGTPMSIPGGKRSGRKNMETGTEIAETVSGWAEGLLESLGLKQKRVDNRIYDRTVAPNWVP